MFFVVEQNTDLCQVSGYPFASLQEALQSTALKLGLDVRAVNAEVRVLHGPVLPCWIVQPADESTGLCQEGRMHLIAQTEDAIDIAMRLTRRNKIYGCGAVERLA